MSRRSFIVANLAVLLTAIVLSIGYGASLVETVIHMTRYFANPPASFSTWYGDQTHTIAFWLPLQTGGLVLLIVALVLNWQSVVRKRLLLIGLAFYVAVAVWNGVYFAPEVRWLLRMAQASAVPTDFTTRAHRWYELTWVRQWVMAVPYIASMLALAVPFGAKGKVACIGRPIEALDARA